MAFYQHELVTDIYSWPNRNHTCTIGHCFIRVNALIEVLPIEKVLQKLLDLGNASGASHQDNVMDLSLVHLGVTESLFHRLQGSSEQVCIQLLKPGPGDGGVEIDALVQRIDFDAGLGAGRQGALGPLASRAQTAHCPLVVADVFLVLALELGDEVVDHAVIKVFSAQVRVACCGLHLKDAIFDGQDGDVKCATAQVKDQDVSFRSNLEFEIL